MRSKNKVVTDTRIFLFIFILASSFSGSLFGQKTYYVSQYGSDSNSGTSSNSPWKSLSKLEEKNFQP